MTDNLTEDIIAEYKEAFQIYDREGHPDTLTTKDLGAVLRALGQNPTEQDLNRMMQQVDVDRSGTIDFPTFLDVMAQRMSASENEHDLREAFRVFDKQNNGRIPAQELRVAMTTLGEKLTDREVEEMLREANSSGDGFVDYNNFIRIMLKK